MKVTSEMKAFLSNGSHATPDDLRTPEGIAEMSFFQNDMTDYGYTYIGQASVTVEVPDLRELVDNKVDALRRQEAAIRAEATAKCTAIQTQIQNLLAIEYAPSDATEA